MDPARRLDWTEAGPPQAPAIRWNGRPLSALTRDELEGAVALLYDTVREREAAIEAVRRALPTPAALPASEA